MPKMPRTPKPVSRELWESEQWIDSNGVRVLPPDVEQVLYNDVTLMIDNNPPVARAVQFRLAKVTGRQDGADEWAGRQIHNVLLARAKQEGVRPGSFTHELLTQLLHGGAGAWRWIGGYYVALGAGKRDDD